MKLYIKIQENKFKMLKEIDLFITFYFFKSFSNKFVLTDEVNV